MCVAKGPARTNLDVEFVAFLSLDNLLLPKGIDVKIIRVLHLSSGGHQFHQSPARLSLPIPFAIPYICLFFALAYPTGFEDRAVDVRIEVGFLEFLYVPLVSKSTSDVFQAAVDCGEGQFGASIARSMRYMLFMQSPEAIKLLALLLLARSHYDISRQATGVRECRADGFVEGSEHASRRN